MAAAKYYHPDSLGQEAHLLSPDKDVRFIPAGPPSPLKPLHLVSHHRGPSFEDMEYMKNAQREDAVRYRADFGESHRGQIR